MRLLHQAWAAGSLKLHAACSSRGVNRHPVGTPWPADHRIGLHHRNGWATAAASWSGATLCAVATALLPLAPWLHQAAAALAWYNGAYGAHEGSRGSGVCHEAGSEVCAHNPNLR